MTVQEKLIRNKLGLLELASYRGMNYGVPDRVYRICLNSSPAPTGVPRLQISLHQIQLEVEFNRGPPGILSRRSCFLVFLPEGPD